MFIKNNYIAKVTLPGLAIMALALFSSAAWAQSSGNFTASVQTSQCVINTVGGTSTSGSLSGGGTLLDTYIKTPSSSQTTLLITPSIVTGLFNNTEVTSSMPTSANSAKVVVKVYLDGKAVLPETGGSTPNGIIYDERFQQLSTNIFDQIDNCQTASPQCNIGLVLSTLAAHSFNFVATNVGGGIHPVKVTWEFQCTDTNGNPTPCSTAYIANTAGACAGPGTVTVVQTKAFTQSGGVVVQ
jgi:hypothetical protein